MIKKNQFALIFLTVVTMLAVWYIKTPVDADNNKKDPDNSGVVETNNPVNTDTGRLAELSAMRTALRDERNTVTVSLDAILADADATVDSKEKALNDKKALSALTEKEVLLEIQVINMGYRDAFVHASDTGVEVLVVSDEDSAVLANEIINMTFMSFDSYDSVVVNFKPASELQK